jgi:hypothetical protein
MALTLPTRRGVRRSIKICVEEGDGGLHVDVSWAAAIVGCAFC